MINAETQHFIDQHGPWTAMSIKLADGSYTRKQAVDHRLRRLVQTAQDSIGKPLSQCRVLDLACLEGHYAIEFALQGAEAVGIEGRQVSVDKCNYAKNRLNLNRVSFFKDDVLNLSVEKYGKFDIVICSGILYHLTAPDCIKLVNAMFAVCTGILLLDTFIALSSQTTSSVDGRTLHGHYYDEHDGSDASRSTSLWASLDNTTSFWVTESTLVNLLIDAGFTSVTNVLSPTMPGNMADRRTYLAIRGTKSSLLSSDATNNEPLAHLIEGKNTFVDASQTPRGRIFKAAKRMLPPQIKEAIKPTLRALKVLPPDPTPEFMKERKAK